MHESPQSIQGAGVAQVLSPTSQRQKQALEWKRRRRWRMANGIL